MSAPVPCSECANCGIPAISSSHLKKCSGCLKVAYCDKNCQQEDRKRHKQDCFKIIAAPPGLFEKEFAAMEAAAKAVAGQSGPVAFEHQGKQLACTGFNICVRCRKIILLQGQPTFKINIDGTKENACRECMAEWLETQQR